MKHAATFLLFLVSLVGLSSGAQASEVPFLLERDYAAWVVSLHTEASFSEVLDAWKGAPYRNQVAVVAAVKQLDADYVWASSNPEVGFDCSGLIRYAWRQAGVTLPTNSSRQIKATYDAPMHAGDLMWYPGHIMMWLGVDNYVIHAASRRLDVIISEASRMERIGSVMPPIGMTRAF